MQLLILLVLVMVPSIGIVINSALDKRTEQLVATRSNLWQLADLIADQLQDTVLSAQQMGSSLAQIPEVQNHNAQSLTKILADRLNTHANFSAVVVADKFGNVTASYPRKVDLHSIASRRSFKNAKASGLFSSGEFFTETASDKSYFSFAYPLTAADGTFNGVVDIEISRNIFQSIDKNVVVPVNPNFTIVDNRGIILHSYPHPNIVGNRDLPANFIAMQQGSNNGDYFTGHGNDGLLRLFYYRKSSLEHEATPYQFILVSKPTDSIMETAVRDLIIDIMALGAFTMIAFFLVGVIGKRSIADRVKVLETSSLCLAEGDLSVRVSGLVVGGELGRLAGAFDQMAVQLEARDNRHEIMLDEIRFKESKFESLYRLSQMASESEKVIKDFALEEGVRSTGSVIGYIYFVNEDETTLTLHAWSRNVMAACHISDKKTVYNVADTGLWGEAIRHRKPIITNDYTAYHRMKKGCPEGHVPIEKHMNIPLIIDGKIVLLAGVGNKGSDYTQNDIQMLTLIMDSMWKMLDKKHYIEDRLKNERFLATLINASLESTYLLATDGTVVIANKVFAKRVGVKHSEVVGKNVFDLFQMEVASYRKQQFEIATTTGKPLAFEDQRDGIDFLHSVNPVIDHQGSVSHIAVHSMDVTTLKAFDKEIISTNLKLQALNQKVENAREEERRTIARELHDQMGQALTGLSLDLKWLTAQLDQKTTKNLDSHIVNMHISVDTLIAMVQNITAKLSPPLLDNLGLAPAIGYYVKEFGRKSGLSCHLMLDEGADCCVSLDESMSVFRILQESLTNVARHAAATEVAVSLCLTALSVVLEVADDGKGTTAKDISSPTAFGILGMQERAKICGGTLVILGNPAGGTIVRLEIPARKGDISSESFDS